MASELAYRAAHESAALIDRSDRARIVVSGADRGSYLHGLLTNDIVALRAGEGCYAAYLTAQGRMITDVVVYELGDVMLLTVPLDVKETVLAKLDQFIFSEDVQLRDVTGTLVRVAVAGPNAPRILSAVLEGISSDVLASLPDHSNRRLHFGGQPAIVARVSDVGAPAYDVYIERLQAGAFNATLHAAGVVEADAATAETIRIEAGVPKFGLDMDQETIPLEAGIESRAISFSKGCYVGQEVIIRVLHRGHGRIARRLTGLVVEGDAVPAAGARVHADDREIGRVTSSAMSPVLKRPIALAYLHRDFLAAGTAVALGGARAVVTDLPFVRQ